MANKVPTTAVQPQSSNKKTIIIIVVLLIVFGLLVYFFFFKKGSSIPKAFKESYRKKNGEWVGCEINEYNKDFYQTVNTSGSNIYVRKSDVKIRPSSDNKTQCADATKDTIIYSLNIN